MTFGHLQGTPSYDTGSDMYAAFSAAVGDCDGPGKISIATYDSQSGDTSFTATSLAKKFVGPDGDMLIVTSGPLNDPSDDMASVHMADIFALMKAAEDVDTAIANLGDGQPTCGDPTSDYIFCISAPDDIDDVIFVEHPVAPSGLVLGTLKGTGDYDLAAGFATAVISAVTVPGCTETGKYALATYPWMDSDTFTTSVSVTSLVKDFTDSDGNRMICGSSPLMEL